MNPFLSYFQHTRHLCVYQLATSPLSTTLFFPHITRLTLIDCSRGGISHLLHPKRFPQLKQIHYLSGHPGIYHIHRRFSNKVSWVFPNYDYAFYNCMMEAGYGKKSNDLISSYIVGKQVKSDKTYFDIHVPGHGRTDGELYQSHMHHYFHSNKIVPDSEHLSHFQQGADPIQRGADPIQRGTDPIQLYERRVLEREFIEHIMKDSQ